MVKMMKAICKALRVEEKAKCLTKGIKVGARGRPAVIQPPRRARQTRKLRWVLPWISANLSCIELRIEYTVRTSKATMAPMTTL
jgi:hypothetical protein